MTSKLIAKNTIYHFIVLTMTSFLISCGVSDEKNINNIVPHEIVFTKKHTVKWAGSFDESEGFGLYQLSDATSKEITEQGLSFFTNVKGGKTEKWSYTGNWIMYEGPIDFSWITSIRARLLFDEQKWSDDNIYTIYANGTKHAGGIIVIPELNLVNVYHQS